MPCPNLGILSQTHRLALSLLCLSLCGIGRLRLRREVVEWARAVLASIGHCIRVVPAPPCKVEPAEAECDEGAQLTIALRCLALLYAWALGFCQLPPADDHTLWPCCCFRRGGYLRRILRVADKLDGSTQRAHRRSPRVKVIEQLLHLRGDSEKDTNL